MRFISAYLASLFLFAASAALADSRVFIMANQAEGYGVDHAWRGATNAARMPPAPTASRGISRKPPPSIRTR